MLKGYFQIIEIKQAKYAFIKFIKKIFNTKIVLIK